MIHLFRISAAAGLLAGAAALAADPMPLNRPIAIDGVRAVCTGIGQSQLDDPSWNAYPAKVEVVGHDGQYLAGETVTIADHGRTVLEGRCGAPLLYAKLSPGRYEVTVHRDGKSTSGLLAVPRQGQGKAILWFPRQGGTVSASFRRAIGDQGAGSAMANP